MSKNLPNVFAVPINKNIKNNEEINYNRSSEIKKESFNKNEINKIFGSKNHVYKTKVQIITNKNEYIVDLVGMKDSYLLTLDGKQINIDDIVEIKKM